MAVRRREGLTSTISRGRIAAAKAWAAPALAMLLAAGCGGGRGAGMCRPPAALPAGQTCGPVVVDATCTEKDPSCGPWGLCDIEAGHCSGGTNACCTIDYDCYDGECVDGVCASVRMRCGCDSDCTRGALCFDGTCLQPPGSACAMADDCTGMCTGGQCGCGTIEQQAPCRSTLDCCSGTCVDGVCRGADESGPCATNADCRNGACMAGACRCLPPGAMSLGDTANEGCCSASVVAGVCQ